MRPSPFSRLSHLFRPRQGGAATTEFLLVAPLLLVLGLGGYQGALIWQAKTVLDYATFEAARWRR